MNFVEKMHALAREKQKKVVLPEGDEPRTLQAARIIADQKLASRVVLLGEEENILKRAAELKVDLNGVEIIDPETSDLMTGYAEAYYELRKHKGINQETARQAMLDTLIFGTMMVKLDDVDAMVAGARNATAKVLMAGFSIIKTAPGVSFASSCMVMSKPGASWGHNGMMIFADCATIIEPTVEQLAEIAIASSQSCRNLLGVEPITAMLSFSTKGSAKHERADKVIEALKIVREKQPDLRIDGELQLDAALAPEVARQKAPDSPVAGRANVLIFPSLEAGNIGYKLVQRFAEADAYGPFLQGFAKPISDLSRGCTTDEIVNTAAATMAQVE